MRRERLTVRQPHPGLLDLLKKKKTKIQITQLVHVLIKVANQKALSQLMIITEMEGN